MVKLSCVCGCVSFRIERTEGATFVKCITCGRSDRLETAWAHDGTVGIGEDDSTPMPKRLDEI